MKKHKIVHYKIVLCTLQTSNNIKHNWSLTCQRDNYLYSLKMQVIIVLKLFIKESAYQWQQLGNSISFAEADWSKVDTFWF